MTAAESVAATSLGGNKKDGGDQNGGKDLSEAIESLPELLARKANLEAHTNILQAVMKNVAARDVPTYFEVEQGILTTGRVDKNAIITLLKDGVKGTIEDKARLLLVVTVCGADSTGKVPDSLEFEMAFVEGTYVLCHSFHWCIIHMLLSFYMYTLHYICTYMYVCMYVCTYMCSFLTRLYMSIYMYICTQ